MQERIKKLRQYRKNSLLRMKRILTGWELLGEDEEMALEYKWEAKYSGILKDMINHYERSI